ncbi:hypothetical protein [Pararhizobium sp. PWRC1-1]|uniref:hypothetical protein n=1 Tax=Pararhizobium sp. PWRC1-1 TaxID=2804566 RepID=UPI003CF37AC4
MKKVLIIAATIGLAATAAFAECDYHKVNAQADADRSMTTASVTADEQKIEDVVLLKKTDSTPADAAVTE